MDLQISVATGNTLNPTSVAGIFAEVHLAPPSKSPIFSFHFLQSHNQCTCQVSESEHVVTGLTAYDMDVGVSLVQWSSLFLADEH